MTESDLYAIKLMLPFCTAAIVFALLGCMRQLVLIRRELERPAIEPEQEYGIKASDRRGFTLIELLVVMALMVLMAGFAIMFFPNAASSAREARAAQAVQGWLNIAKQRAMRDRRPYGVRLWIAEPDGRTYVPPAWANGTPYGQLDAVMSGGFSYRCVAAHTAAAANTPPSAAWVLTNLVTDCQFIEQPEDFATEVETVNGWRRNIAVVGGVPPGAPAAYNPLSTLEIHFPAQPPAQALPPSFLVKKPVDITNGAASVSVPVDANAKYWPVQPGDYIHPTGTGLAHQIIQVGVPGMGETTSTVNTQYVVIRPQLSIALATPSAAFRIQRAPRPVGDETLKLPSDAVIDLDTNTVFSGQAFAGGYMDILFSPSGTVISRAGVASANVHLWVRCPNQEQPAGVFRGATTIVSVFTRTGMVGAYSPDPTGPSPYSLVK